MTAKCTVCLRLDRPEIDSMLSAGNGLRGVASRFHVSRSSLHRHSTHASRPPTAKVAPTTSGQASTLAHGISSRTAPTGRAQRTRVRPACTSPPEVPADGAALADARGAERPTEEPLADSSTAEMIGELSRLVRAHLIALRTDADLTTFDRSRLEVAAVTAIGVLSKLEGRTDASSEARVIRHPACRRVFEVIVASAAPWPEAQKAIAEAMRRFGRGQS